MYIYMYIPGVLVEHPSRYWMGVTNRLQTFTPRSRFPDQFNPAGSRRIENGGSSAWNRGPQDITNTLFRLPPFHYRRRNKGTFRCARNRKYTIEDA